MTAINQTPTQQALANFQSLPDAAQTRLPVVAAIFGISPATVWRRVHTGHLPKPRKFGKRTTCWQVGELRAHLTGATA
jgi:predicted DNA-binding transcriptional regulator AlpA